jgi:hypothetical protein
MRGADQVAVDGVTSRTTSRLDLHQDAQLVVDGVDLIGDPLAPLVAQVDWPPDLLGAMLAALYLVADLEESGPQVGQDLSLASPSTVAESIKGRAAATTSSRVGACVGSGSRATPNSCGVRHQSIPPDTTEVGLISWTFVGLPELSDQPSPTVQRT